MFFVIVYAIKSNIWKPNLKRFWISAFSISITIVLIHLINLYKNSLGYNTNYFWTMYPDPRFPVINEWIFPYHTLFLSFGLIFLGFVFYFIVDKLIISKKIR